MDGDNTLTLDTKYSATSGRVFVTGVQALTRLPMMQRQRDMAAGLNTAGYITGYRGSPLGTYDSALWRASDFLERHHIRFQPGVNEDIAATACWGTQQIGIWRSEEESPKYDGVFAIWYGKGPGVDRSGDPFKHGNMAGTSRHGGVLVLMGDDHGAKSSTSAHQSEQALIAAMIPILYPASVQEYIDYGLFGIAMGRYSGCWTGIKCVGDVVESSASVDIDPDRIAIKEPEDLDLPDDGVHIRWPDTPLVQEQRLVSVKLKAALAFARANKLDRVTHAAPVKRLGIVAAGKAWLDVCQAFEELNLSDEDRKGLGISVFKVAVPWPLEPEGIREWAAGNDEILVIEEKRNIIEDQLARALYDLPEEHRPRIVGRSDHDGNPLTPEFGELSGTLVAQIIANRHQATEPESCLNSAVAAIQARTSDSNRPSAPPERSPWFCAGCPHNTSTKVPEGSRALAGIGCHTMSIYMNRRTAAYTHMGGEGGTWIGQAPFTTTKHVFQNIGDGTYVHSGILGIRAAVAAGVNITFKILYNDAVALTGGQPMDGEFYPWNISRQIAAEGVGRIAVVTDEPGKYPSNTQWAAQVEIFHRRELERIQEEMREVLGVTAIIYDQTCAAEKRRRRKRGAFPDPARRVYINAAVCEGCSECNRVANCVAVQPLDTELGRKRTIDQSSCNKDFTCLEAFCPSFVTVEGGALRKAAAPDLGEDNPAAGLPEPEIAKISDSCNILLTGIGGTGVITAGALLGAAAHLEGKGCTVLDQTGLAQKNGAVMSHVRITEQPDRILGGRVGTAMADLILGFDMVVAAGKAAVNAMNAERTNAVINDHLVPLAAFAEQPDMPLQADGYTNVIRATLGKKRVDFMDATRTATKLLGDSMGANIFIMGYASQKGYMPLAASSIQEAIRLNNVAVEMNLEAFAWGRVAAADPERMAALIGDASAPEPAFDLSRFISDRKSDLSCYQNSSYGEVFETLIKQVSDAEQSVAPGKTDLTEATARALFKLMAYKDEYEVARLYNGIEQKIAEQFEGGYQIRFHFAPPIMGEYKREFRPWMARGLKFLKNLKSLRGTALDPFGYHADRRDERRLAADYQALLRELSKNLMPHNYQAAVQLAALPMSIRGYGPVKRKAITACKQEEKELLHKFRTSGSVQAGAAE